MAVGRIAIGGQNCPSEHSGAFTGDLSADMLKDAGAAWVIVGHSERPKQCASGVGASFVANKVPRVGAGLIHDVVSAHQGIEGDDMNVLCLGGKAIGSRLGLEPVEIFLRAHFG